MANLDTDKELALKQMATELTISMLDNHNGDWNDEMTARAFQTIYKAVRDT